jgi:hypothetical protein
MRTAESRRIISAVLISLCFMGGIAGAASAAGMALLLFPELAALSYDVFLRPRGTWARAPWMLALSPAMTAVLGVLVTRYLPYSAASIAICIVGAMVILKLMRSPIAPAISACFLALSLGEKSWLYPLAILLGTGALAVLSSHTGGSSTREPHTPRRAPPIGSTMKSNRCPSNFCGCRSS